MRWPLRVSAYPTPAALPDELVTSVRCVVRVGDLIVFCENADGGHPWPGGRRHPDFLQVVLCGTDRDGGPDASWTDTDGYEQDSRLVTINVARETTSTDLLAPIFLDLLSPTS